MHDFHLADQIFHTILDYAAKNKFKKVTKAVIEIGSIVEHGEEILPENLKFNIKLLAEGSPLHKVAPSQVGLAKGFIVEVKRVEGRDWVLREIEGE